nr:site-specific integrase [uncultured Oscillibacter sp.]
MIKKSNFMASQGKEDRPASETVSIFTAEEIEIFKDEAVRTWGNGERIYQQAAAYTLMLNTGLRTGEALGLLNNDIDLEGRVIHLQRGVKEVAKRDGLEATSGREVKVGKLKTASSKRDIPLNQAAVNAILELRAERYFGENTPLIPDEQGNFTRPVNFRKRYYRILDAAGLEQRGLHTLRHTFATNLVNGVKQPDGSIKSLSPRQVADLLGHSTSEITELYYVKKDTARLAGITTGFEL